LRREQLCELNGGDDGTRTRGLLRDKQTSESLCQQSVDLGARIFL
jgi:hypothetical protein